MAYRSRKNCDRQFGVGLMLAALMLGVILLPGASTTSAQSGAGAFQGAILELVPTNPNPTAANTNIISTVTAGAVGSSFYIEGTVYRNRTVQADCTINALGNTPVSEDQDGGIVGKWRMWGVRTAQKTNDPIPTVPTSNVGQPISSTSISGGNIAVVNMSVELEGFNGTLQFQGVLGRDFGAIESAGHLASDILAITGGTGTFRGASGDGVLTPLVVNSTITGTPPFPTIATPCPAASAGAGGFQLFLKEGFKPPRFTNVIPAP